MNPRRRVRAAALSVVGLLAAAALAACGGGSVGSDVDAQPSSSGSLVVYSGRNEDLVAPVIEAFEKASGIDVEVRYGSTPEMAAQLLEEGQGTPADVYFSQDAGALQALEDAGLLAPLSSGSVAKVADVYRSASGQWVGISGRARVLTYNTELVPAAQLPDSVFDLTDPAWKGQVGWAPTNASFQSFVTAMRLSEGDAVAEKWIADMVANGAQSFESNSEIREAVDAGTIKVGLSNHYYLYEKIAEVGAGSVTAANHYLGAGDPGSLVNVAGVGILAPSQRQAQAQALVDYLLSTEGQTYFAETTFEYPLVDGVPTAAELRPLAELQGPGISLGQLSDVAATQAMLSEAGLI
ncbi:MAG: iron ABC transporter substrate-binding protein [Actinobacteria bacterium]|nr:iron ABC transporter substrate-binding protein [Actinomycetota bacterium]